MNQPRALIVDDSLTVRIDLRSALSNAGFLVSGCGTQSVALSTLSSRAFHLAVLDIHLPDGSGLDILKVLRSDPQFRRMRAILLSTEAEVRSRVRGLLRGADLYIGKPYDRGYVARMARELCHGREGRERPHTAQRATSGKKILVLSEEGASTHALLAELRQDGHDVVLARSEADAFTLLECESVACVVIECGQSDNLDVEVCRRLRRVARAPETSILLLCTRPDPELVARARAAGADDVMDRPALPELLNLRVRSLLLRKYQLQGAMA